MSDVKNSPGFLEQAFTVLILWFSATDLLNLLQGADASLGYLDTSNQLQQYLFFVVYFACTLLILRNWKHVLYELLKRDKIFWLVMVMVFASVLWSAYPDITMRRSIALLGTTLIGVYISTRYTMKQQLNLMCWTWGLVAISSLVFALGLPKYGLMPRGTYAGAWRGIFTHKNSLGKSMVWGGIVFNLLAMRGGAIQLIALPCVALCALLIVMTKSTTALGMLLLMLTLIYIYRGLRLHSSLLVVASASVCVLVGWVVVYIAGHTETILGAMNKDATLTGRTDMWPFIWEKIQERFWLGYGYEGFWRGWDAPCAYVWRAAGWMAPHSHNGFLEMMLIFGAVGTSLYLFGFFCSFVRSMRMVRVTQGSEFLFPIMFLSFTLASSITETGGILNYNSDSWVLFTMTVLSRLKCTDPTIVSDSEAEEPNYVPDTLLSPTVSRSTTG